VKWIRIKICGLTFNMLRIGSLSGFFNFVINTAWNRKWKEEDKSLENLSVSWMSWKYLISWTTIKEHIKRLCYVEIATFEYMPCMQNYSPFSFFFFFFVFNLCNGTLGTTATTGLLYQPRVIGDGDCGEFGGMKIGKGNRSTRRKPAPAPLCPPQIPHD
jgi:hypothetical protein